MREAAANGIHNQYLCYLCFKELFGSCKSPAGTGAPSGQRSITICMEVSNSRYIK
jgi:hypothetical protein